MLNKEHSDTRKRAETRNSRDIKITKRLDLIVEEKHGALNKSS